MSKRFKAAQHEYAKATIHLSRMVDMCNEQVEKLGYAIERRNRARQDQEDATRRLRMMQDKYPQSR